MAIGNAKDLADRGPSISTSLRLVSGVYYSNGNKNRVIKQASRVCVRARARAPLTLTPATAGPTATDSAKHFSLPKTPEKSQQTSAHLPFFEKHKIKREKTQHTRYVF